MRQEGVKFLQDLFVGSDPNGLDHQEGQVAAVTHFLGNGTVLKLGIQPASSIAPGHCEAKLPEITTPPVIRVSEKQMVKISAGPAACGIRSGAV